MARRDGGEAATRAEDERDGRRRFQRRARDGSLPSLLKRSARRFTLSLSSIVEKYNFPFEDDRIISIKSLMYDTPNGPKAWGEDEDESNNGSHEASQNDCFSFEEEQSMNACEQSPSSTGYKSNSEISSIKRRLENTHLKEDILLASWSGLLENNKYNAEVDILVKDVAYCVNSPTILRTESKTVPEESSFQELMSESLHGPPAVVRRKQQQNRHPESMSLQLYNSTAEVPEDETVICGNLYPRSNAKTACSSFLEIYESADEHCSWNNITIADMYPEMVKTLSRLMHQMYHKSSSHSQIKRYGHGYWHPRRTKFNTAIERVKKVRPLKHSSGLAITKHSEKCKLPIEDTEYNTPLEYGDNQMQCTLLTESSVTSSAYHNTDEMEMDSSGPEEDYSNIERVGHNGIRASIFPNNLSEGKAFHLEDQSWIPSSSDHVRKGQPFEELSTICPDDLGTTFEVIGDETGETSIMPFKASSHLNLPLNRDINQYLEVKSSPVKSPCRLFRNHEIKTFPTAGSLQRSRSFSQLLVNRNRIKVQQKSGDAFEKMYKELCCPQFSKSFKIPNTCTISTKSDDKLLKPELSDWTEFHQKHRKSGNVYLKSRSEGFPKIPTFLRAARLKKYEGVQVSETVNALVNSPVRTLPTVARIKRTAKFSNEDFLSSPVKRLKNRSESFISRVHQKPPHWENINHDKSGMFLTLHSPGSSNWSSNKLDSEFSVTSNRTFLVGPVSYMHESGIAEDYEYVPKLLQSHDILRVQKCSRGVSKKLSYNEGRTRGAYMEEFLCRDYQESFLDEMS